MTFDQGTLRVMLRLARRREAADIDAIAVRSGASPAAVRSSLRCLHASGLIERRGDEPPRLTLAGLAIAVALLPSKNRKGVCAAVRPSRAA